MFEDLLLHIRYESDDHGFGFELHDVTDVLLKHGFKFNNDKVNSLSMKCLSKDSVDIYISFHGKEAYVDNLYCAINGSFISTTAPDIFGDKIRYMFYKVNPLLFVKAVCEPPNKIVNEFNKQYVDILLENLP